MTIGVAAEEKEVTQPLAARFVVTLNDGMTPDEYRIMAGETGPGPTGTGMDQFGNPESIYDLKDTTF